MMTTTEPTTVHQYPTPRPNLDPIDPLAPARGVLLGVGIGVPLWGILGLFIVLAVRLAGGM